MPYINLLVMMLFVGFNMSLVINARLYTNESIKKNDFIYVFKHFIFKHLIPIFICLLIYGISIFFIYDFESKNPFYSSIRSIAIALFCFMCINYVYIMIRTYIVKKNISKDEPIICAENFIIIIYYFVCLNTLVCFATLFLNMLLARLY